MKTSIHISDTLHEEARKIAAAEKTTVKALIEEALQRILAERKRKKRPFRLRKATFRGNGLHPDAEDGSWEKIRQRIYEGRGG